MTGVNQLALLQTHVHLGGYCWIAQPGKGSLPESTIPRSQSLAEESWRCPEKKNDLSKVKWPAGSRDGAPAQYPLLLCLPGHWLHPVHPSLSLSYGVRSPKDHEASNRGLCQKGLCWVPPPRLLQIQHFGPPKGKDPHKLLPKPSLKPGNLLNVCLSLYLRPWMQHEVSLQ